MKDWLHVVVGVIGVGLGIVGVFLHVKDLLPVAAGLVGWAVPNPQQLIAMFQGPKP